MEMDKKSWLKEIYSESMAFNVFFLFDFTLLSNARINSVS